MPESLRVAKAELQELDAKFENVINPERTVTVQFNPESVKVSFANQIATPSGSGDQKGTPGRQFVGAGTTKLSLQIWFDVSVLGADHRNEQGQPIDDVRKLTQKVAYFITPRAEGKQFVPPAVRFAWGSFQFDGLMDSLDESLEFWSNDGKPLRANMTLALSQQKIQQFTFRDTGASPAGAATPGTRPLTAAPAGSNLPSLADAQPGGAADWQSIAAANNIENPRLLAPGQLIDMHPPSVDLSAGAGVSGGLGVPGGLGVSGQLGLSGQIGVA